MTAGFAVLLWKARHALRSQTLTPLSQALSFLHAEYEPRWFFWDLVRAATLCGGNVAEKLS